MKFNEKKMGNSTRTQTILVLIGGFVVHLVLGCAYLWGELSGYVTSYLYQYDSNATVQNLYAVVSITIVCLNVCLPWSYNLAEKYGEKKTLCFGLSLYCLSAFLASFLQSVTSFLLVYPMLAGFGAGISYTVPIRCGWKYLPNRKGLVSGIVVAGFGVGPFIFNFITQAIVNPEDLEANETTKRYPESVYKNVPKLFRCLAGIWLLMSLVGIALVRAPSEGETDDDGDEKETPLLDDCGQNEEKPMERTGRQVGECQSISEGLTTKQYKLLVSMAFFSLSYSIFLLTVYKTIGTGYGYDDFFMTIVGAIGLLCNGIFRAFWGFVMDLYGFKSVFAILLGVQSCCILLMAFFENAPTIYAIAVIVSLFCEGGHFSIFPGETGVFFGAKIGTLMYAFVFMGFTATGFAGIIFEKVIQPLAGNQGMFLIFLGMTGIAAILLYFFDDRIDWTLHRARLNAKRVEGEKLKEEKV